MNIVTLFKMPGENNEQIQILSIEDGKRFSNVLDVLISQKVNEDGLTLSEIFTNKDMTFRFNKILENTFTEIKEYYEGTSEYGNFFTIPTKRELDKIEDTYEKLKPIIENKTIQKYNGRRNRRLGLCHHEPKQKKFYEDINPTNIIYFIRMSDVFSSLPDLFVGLWVDVDPELRTGSRNSEGD